MEKRISKIVVVDSNDGVCKGLKDYFLESKNDLRVVASFSGLVDAIDYISDNDVDVVICDIVLPNADGFELISEIRALGLKTEPKIIIVSALSGEGFIQKAFNMGVSYYLVKPINYELLENRILSVLKDEFSAEKTLSIEKDRLQGYARPKNKGLDEKITNIFITVGNNSVIKT